MNKYSKVTEGETLCFPWKLPPQTNNLVSVGDILAGVAGANGEVVSLMVRVSFVSAVENIFSSSMRGSNLKAGFFISLFLNMTKKTIVTVLEEGIELSAEAIGKAQECPTVDCQTR
ncbi:Hypothetical predicted protein [Paramuricea clavata]|uniref:Uncharacterized protein n=1 Tax=Paramuricea clavata TaxID=317549 RepID=A0A6S7K050_PARCT|nr:Hypothetical predicted protein [Paramuricea clavata]